MGMRLLGLLVVAAAIASSAAAVPDGFRASARLSPIAAEISGKPAEVYCASGASPWATWLTLMRSVNAPPASTGYVPPTDDVAYLSPDTCQELEGWIRGKNIPKLEQLGWSVLTLVHESMHVRGLDNEGETDCAALAAMPRVLRVHFKVRKPAVLKTVMVAAWKKHRLSGPAYQGNC